MLDSQAFAVHDMLFVGASVVTALIGPCLASASVNGMSTYSYTQGDLFLRNKQSDSMLVLSTENMVRLNYLPLHLL